MKSRTSLFVVLTTLLAACTAPAPTEHEPPLEDPGWCEATQCESPRDENPTPPEPDEPEPEAPTQPTDPVDPVEPVEPTDPDPTPAPDPIDPEPTEPEPELWVEPPLFQGRIDRLATNATTACATFGEEIACWGSNYGDIASPPDDIWLTERLVMSDSYACSISAPGGIICWGDGAERIAAYDQIGIITRHTIFGASSAANTLCVSNDYGILTSEITCANGETSWKIGAPGAIQIDVTEERAPDGQEPIRTYCYVQLREWDTPVEYICERGDERIILPFPDESLGTAALPTIKQDGDGEVGVLSSRGDVAWFDLDQLYTDDATGALYATKIDTPEWDELNEAWTFTELPSADCAYADYPMYCKTATHGAALVVRESGVRVAAHQRHDGSIRYCHERAYDQTTVSCEQTYLH